MKDPFFWWCQIYLNIAFTYVELPAFCAWRSFPIDVAITTAISKYVNAMITKIHITKICLSEFQSSEVKICDIWPQSHVTFSGQQEWSCVVHGLILLSIVYLALRVFSMDPSVFPHSFEMDQLMSCWLLCVYCVVYVLVT